MSFYMCARVHVRAHLRVCVRAPACPPARLPACPPARLPACPPARSRQYGLDCSESPAEHRFGVVAIDNSGRGVRWLGGPFMRKVGCPPWRLPSTILPSGSCPPWRLPSTILPSGSCPPWRLPSTILPSGTLPLKTKKDPQRIAPRASTKNQDFTYLTL